MSKPLTFWTFLDVLGDSDIKQIRILEDSKTYTVVDLEFSVVRNTLTFYGNLDGPVMALKELKAIERRMQVLNNSDNLDLFGLLLSDLTIKGLDDKDYHRQFVVFKYHIQNTLGIGDVLYLSHEV